MTTDLIGALGVPIAGIAGEEPFSAGQFVLRDGKLVGFARNDHEAALTTGLDLAADLTLKVPVLQTVDDEIVQPIDRLADLRTRSNEHLREMGRLRHVYEGLQFSDGG
jgi:hypothetical protein